MSFESPNINIISSALRKALKFLIRDYGEIMHLQSSPKGTQIFAGKTYDRVKEIICHELMDARPDYKIYEASNIVDEDCEYRWIVEPLEGIKNFEHSIPLFCVCVALQKKEGKEFKTIAAMVEAPALEEVYCAERGEGSWCENYSRFAKGRIRMRVSNRSTNKECMISANINNAKYNNFGANLLEMIFVATGKIDACIIKTNNNKKYDIARLFVEESKGYFKSKPGLVIASNSNLQKELSKV